MKTDGIALEGTALVTAGAAGIGRVIAETLQAHGARVHVCDIDKAALADLAAANPAIGTSIADVSSRASVDALFDSIESTYGALDILVNNAGVGGPTAEIADVDPDEWDRTLAVGLNGNFYCSRRAAPLLKASCGVLINMASTAGLMGCPGRTPYVATKWAIVGMTKTLAMELGKDGVRVNAICPGSVEGERIERIIGRDAERLACSEEEIRTAYERAASMRVFVSAQDVANMALFLASPLARYVSGQIIGVDGNTETFSTYRD